MVRSPFEYRFCFPDMAVLLACLLLGLHPQTGASGELLETPAATPSEFSLQDLSGQIHSLGDFGGRVILINFWASWCRPCIAEMPAIQRLAGALQGRPFVVLAINVGESRRRVQAATRRLGIGFPVLLDKDNAVFESWRASVLPAARVIDCRGKIRYRAEGPIEWDRAEIIATLQALAAEGCGRPSTRPPAAVQQATKGAINQ